MNYKSNGMKKYYSLLILLLVLISCTLSGDQEKKLNESLSAYLFSRNECRLVNYVAFSYPDMVIAYKSQGDSAFQRAFDCNLDSLYLENPTLRQTIKENNEIHVEYDLDAYHKATNVELEDKHKLVAISSDNGKSWFFIDKENYFNTKLLPNLKRLLKK
jgi:hypothetical protein